jgi:chorismate--pyruvate lyase
MDGAVTGDAVREGALVDGPATLWLPGAALNCYEGDARLRSWLLEPGVLTSRMRHMAGADFRLNVVHEVTDSGGHLRAIELCAGARAWLYAETRVPGATLSRHSWLATLQGRALGEVLAARHDVRREPLVFARELDTSPLIARALARRPGLAPQPLWVRRSGYQVGGAPFLLHEVFYPDTGIAD